MFQVLLKLIFAIKCTDEIIFLAVTHFLFVCRSKNSKSESASSSVAKLFFDAQYCFNSKSELKDDI